MKAVLLVLFFYSCNSYVLEYSELGFSIKFVVLPSSWDDLFDGEDIYLLACFRLPARFI